MKHLVLGIGNLLLGDEGAGVHAAQTLQRQLLPPGVTVLEAGTAILDALPFIEEAEHIVVVDAMKGGRAPGTVYRVPLEDCEGAACIASLHGFSLAQVVTLSGRETRPRVTVIDIEPGSFDWSVDLSPPVAAAMPALLDEVRRLVGAWPEDAAGK